MLPRSQRLPKDLLKASRGTRVFFGFGSLLLLSRTPHPQAAVVVSKKTCPSAVLRNKLRRRVYHALRNLMKEGLVKTNLIVYPSRRALPAPFSDLERALGRALPK